MLKNIFFTCLLTFVFGLSLQANVCYQLSNTANVLEISIVPDADHDTKWVTGMFTLSWSSSLGTAVLDTYTAKNGFTFEPDGPVRTDAGVCYQKFGFVFADPPQIALTNGVALQVLEIAVTHPSLSMGTFTIVEAPTAQQTMHGAASFQHVFGELFASNGCTLTAVDVPFDLVKVKAKSFLAGNYSSSNGLMNDNLRANSLIPTTEPYTALGFTHVNGGNETCNASVFTVTGNDAIVDWIFLELRDKNDASIVLHTRSAFIQRDGDIVDVDGISDVTFSAAASDDYYVAVRHRNHLGCMTSTTAPLGGTATLLDFTTSSTWGINAQKDLGNNLSGLWSGDTNHNGILSYNGSANDRVATLLEVGFLTPNNVVSGYHTNDANMDGLVKYNGSASDRVAILLNLGFTTPNNSITQQLP